MDTNSRGERRCAAHGLSRRDFLAGSSVASAAFLSGCTPQQIATSSPKLAQAGPASRCVPTIKACFVRRKGDYGMWWPGAVYDGKAARKKYTQLIAATAKQYKVKLDMRAQPVHSTQEADAWVADAKTAKPDGLLVVLLDRQRHAWPTANKAIDTKIPTVIFSPVGSSFTTNTTAPSKKTGCFICSTDDFSQVKYGMKMLQAWAKLRATRCVVIRGSKRAEREIPHLGIKLQYVPAKEFLTEYAKTPTDDEVQALAADYMKRARRRVGATKQDVLNGVKSYVVARTILKREQCDAITMDCLGALGRSKVSLPCIAWSRMNDEGIPAACEADLGAVATHAIVQYLFDRSGFQQDPVAETARRAIIGAHCCCPTKLRGFSQPPEPFDLVHHHGMRDAVPRTLWRVGQRVTSADVLPGRATKMIISAGEVLKNIDVPPAGGCVVSVMVKFDGVTDVLAYPGFHQIFFYGDFKDQLVQFCRLVGIEPMVV
ncbi:MAG: twin-arginine translocation signal domain-containing protein [Phycisphaerae bacterium]|nr:twin-arginine translocation signal domain-containing protein [Phycisphaerae bacterium]